MPYSREGWGQPCHTVGGFTTITLSNGVRLTVATGIADLTLTICNSVIRDGYAIRSGVTGGYNCRKISGSDSWSNHAWGLAIDINWDTNPWRNPLTTDMPSWMVDRFTRYGWRWGGHYSGTKDAMHYEYLGTPDQAAADSAEAVRDLTGTPPDPGEPVDPPVWPPVDFPNSVWGLYPLDTGKRTLKLTEPRQTGGDVEYLQWVMHNVVGLSVDCDGWYGTETEARVMNVQSFNNLEQDGICGPATWAVIDTYASQE